MDMLLKGKRALVTGNISGIGAQCARVLADEGVFTTDGGTASPAEGGPQPAKLVKVELLTEAAVR
jgi:NAD(P)-dependent dehydrogenase (short-subunit alcohol dehydrogenase family)